MSFAEAVTNVVAGYGIALLTQVLAFPMFGLQLALSGNVMIAGIFTIISLVRSYLLRRLFEQLRLRGSLNDTAARAGGGSGSSDGVLQSAIR